MRTVGIIGSGHMGTVHTTHYLRIPGVEVVVWDADPARLSAFCQKHGVLAASSHADLMSKADLVDVCLPTDLHLSTALEAIAAGRHVFVEKPICPTVADCRTLMSAADKAGVKLVPGHVVRYFKEFRTAHDLVVNGKVGKPAAARVRRGGKTPLGSDGWFRDIHRSGGVLLDLAVHDFDWLNWTLGPVTSVYSRSVGVAGTSNVPGDYALTTLKFGSGAVAHTETTWMDPSGFRTSLEVCGSDGMIEFDSRNNQAVKTLTDGAVVYDNALHSTDDPFYQQLSTALAYCFDGGEPGVTALEGAQAVAIAEAALTSARTQKWVNIELI